MYEYLVETPRARQVSIPSRQGTDMYEYLSESFGDTQRRKAREAVADEANFLRLERERVKALREDEAYARAKEGLAKLDSYGPSATPEQLWSAGQYELAVKRQQDQLNETGRMFDSLSRMARSVLETGTQEGYDKALEIIAAKHGPEVAAQLPRKFDPVYLRQASAALEQAKAQLPNVRIVKGRRGGMDVNVLYVIGPNGEIQKEQVLTSGPAWNPNESTGGSVGRPGGKTGGLTAAQERENQRIEDARREIRSMGPRDWKMLRMTDPRVADLLRWANKRKYGPDPKMDEHVNRNRQPNLPDLDRWKLE